MKKKKAIILAAGKGQRLSTITDNMIPKCMIEFEDIPILKRQIKTFTKCHVSDISVVVGHKAEQIRDLGVTTILNNKYDQTNMLESLFCAEGKIKEGDIVLISYADIIFEKEILEKLILSDENITLVVDTNWLKYWGYRTKKPFDDAWETVETEKNIIKKIGHEVTKDDKVDGHFIGLMMVQNDGIKDIKNFYHKFRNQATDNYNPLSEDFTFENSRLVDLIRRMIDNGIDVHMSETENGWLEFDTDHDYDVYTELVKNKELHEIIHLKKV